jgi:hypothetical protein
MTRPVTPPDRASTLRATVTACGLGARSSLARVDNVVASFTALAAACRPSDPYCGYRGTPHRRAAAPNVFDAAHVARQVDVARSLGTPRCARAGNRPRKTRVGRAARPIKFRKSPSRFGRKYWRGGLGLLISNVAGCSTRLARSACCPTWASFHRDAWPASFLRSMSCPGCSRTRPLYAVHAST